MFTDVTDLPWLEEVHSKIWNRKDLKPQLFQEVKVTRGDYAALQECLKELHPDRDSQDYNGADVRRVKLEFLRSLTPAKGLPPQHPNDNDNDNRVDDDDDSEDDPVIKKLFPSTLKFLDLSTLGLKETMPTRLPLPLLLRQEYYDISELIKKWPQDYRSSVILSGQPGTGEFLVFLFLII